MIQDIEHLGAELQLQRFTNRKVAVDREVPLGSAERSECIPAQIPLLPGRRFDEGGGIEGLSPGILRSVKIIWLAGNNVWPNLYGLSRQKCSSGKNIHGRCRESLEDAVDGPSAHDRSRERIELRNGHLVGRSDRECMSNVEIRGTSIQRYKARQQSICSISKC